MRHAFGAAAIVAIVAGCSGYFLVLRAQSLRRPCPRACRLHRRDRRGADRHRAAVGISRGDGLRRRRHGRCWASGSSGATSPSASCSRCRSASASCSCISSPPTRRRRPRCCSATCWRSTRRRCARSRCSAAVSLAGLALISRPLLFASLQPELAEAKGVSLRLFSVLFLAHRRAGDRRDAPRSSACCWCFAPDGRARGGGAAPHQPRRVGRAAGSRARPAHLLGRTHARLSTPTGRAASGSPRSGARPILRAVRCGGCAEAAAGIALGLTSMPEFRA